MSTKKKPKKFRTPNVPLASAATSARLTPTVDPTTRPSVRWSARPRRLARAICLRNDRLQPPMRMPPENEMPGLARMGRATGAG